MRSALRTLGFLTFTAVSLAFLACGDDDDDTSGPGDGVDNNDFVAEASFRYAFEVVDHTRLRLEGINGDVSIAGLVDSDSIIVSGVRQVGSESMEDAQEHLHDLDVIVEDLGTEVYARTEQPLQTHGRSYTVNYVAFLPRELAVVAANVNGPLAISSVQNDVTAADVNGSILLDAVFGSATAALVNGTIEADVAIPLGGTIALGVTNGGIDLDIPQSTSAEFSAHVTVGSISVSNLDLYDVESTPTSLTGTLGSGEGTIALSTVNGNIHVTGY
jgi:hypothetical protein